MSIEWAPLFFVYGFSLLAWMLYSIRKWRRQDAAAEERRDLLEDAEKDAGRERWLGAGFDPLECAECHLPGDCPLCGAG